jgi:microcystin-dependent protein
MKHRDFAPRDPLPADWTDAIQELVSGLGAFQVRIKPGAPGTLQVPAGTGNDQVAIPIEGRWRYVTAPVERAGVGSARSVDVYVTAADNVFVAGSPGEVDNTDYSFSLAIVDSGAAAPTGVALKRKVAVAGWDGSGFVAVDPVVGGVVDSGQRWRPGDLKFSARKTAEPGWLLADNSAVTLTYPALRAALIADGSPWGSDGSGNPRLPPMSGRVPMGAGTATGATGATAHAVGDVVGEEKHVLTGAESGVNGSGRVSDVDPHVHDITFDLSAVNYGNTGGASITLPSAGSRNTSPAGGHFHTLTNRSADTAHNNLPPSTVGSWFIKT